jgi:hypothetical protein
MADAQAVTRGVIEVDVSLVGGPSSNIVDYNRTLCCVYEDRRRTERLLDLRYVQTNSGVRTRAGLVVHQRRKVHYSSTRLGGSTRQERDVIFALPMRRPTNIEEG